MSLSVSRPSLSWLPRSLCCVGRTRFLQFYLQVLVSSSGLPPTLNCASCENCCANIQCFVTQVREVTAAAAPVQSKSSRRTEETAGRYLRCETVDSPQVCTLTSHRHVRTLLTVSASIWFLMDYTILRSDLERNAKCDIFGHPVGPGARWETAGHWLV